MLNPVGPPYKSKCGVLTNPPSKTNTTGITTQASVRSWDSALNYIHIPKPRSKNIRHIPRAAAAGRERARRAVPFRSDPIEGSNNSCPEAMERISLKFGEFWPILGRDWQTHLAQLDVECKVVAKIFVNVVQTAIMCPLDCFKMRYISWNSSELFLRYGNPDMQILGTLKWKYF